MTQGTVTLRPSLRSPVALGVMRSRHGATAGPSHDLECGKSAIAANNRRQSRQQHAASQRGIWRRIPAGMTEEGLGAGPGEQKKNMLRFVLVFFSLSAELSRPAWLSSKALGAAGMEGARWARAALPCWHRDLTFPTEKLPQTQDTRKVRYC